MTYSTATDIILIALLVIGCGYCVLLGRRLKKLRDGQTELFQMIEKFDAATQRAERNLAAIQANQALIGGRLTKMTVSAQNLIDELSIMVHAGDNIAARIERTVQEVRAAGSRKGDRRGLAS